MSRARIRAGMVAIGAVAAVALAGAAIAQDPGSKASRDYVQAASQSDTFEVMEAQTALTGSRDPQVRAFAGQMLRDHGQTSQTLREAAARAGLKPPAPGMAEDQARLLGALQSLKGSEFDRAYWRHQALGHRAALTVARLYVASGDAPEVRQAAAATVPTISAHLATAERMEAAPG